MMKKIIALLVLFVASTVYAGESIDISTAEAINHCTIATPHTFHHQSIGFLFIAEGLDNTKMYRATMEIQLECQGWFCGRSTILQHVETYIQSTMVYGDYTWTLNAPCHTTSHGSTDTLIYSASGPSVTAVASVILEVRLWDGEDWYWVEVADDTCYAPGDSEENPPVWDIDSVNDQ